MQASPAPTAANRQPDPHSHAQPQLIRTTAPAQTATAPRYATDFHFPALQQQPAHNPPQAHAPAPARGPTTMAASAPTTGHRQPNILAHNHLQPTPHGNDADHANQSDPGTNSTTSSTTVDATTPANTNRTTPMHMDSTTQPQSQSPTLAAAVQQQADRSNTTTPDVARLNSTTPAAPELTTRIPTNHSSNSSHPHTQPLQPAQPKALHSCAASPSTHVQTLSGGDPHARSDARTAAASNSAGRLAQEDPARPAATGTPEQLVSPSSGTIVMNRVPVSPITPRLLACAQILSGRNLLTEPDIARFGRQHFDHCAFLTEHVCTDNQLAVHVQPQSLSPVMTTFIQSALLTTSESLTSAIIRAHTTDGRTRFDLYAPEPPTHPTIPQRIAPTFISGPMALANVIAIFAVVPRTSPLATLRPRTIPPPAPPRGGGRGEPAYADGIPPRVFQHDVGVAAPT